MPRACRSPVSPTTGPLIFVGGRGYTANTLATAIETMGMTVPGSSSCLAADLRTGVECDSIGEVVKNLPRKMASFRVDPSSDPSPRNRMTRKLFNQLIQKGISNTCPSRRYVA